MILTKPKFNSTAKDWSAYNKRINANNLKLSDEKFDHALKVESIEKAKREKDEREAREQRDDLLNSLQENNPFNFDQFLIVWDVLNHDYNQIMTNIEMERITIQDVLKVFDYIRKSPKAVNEYQFKKIEALA
ncbi:hypothetical protein EBB07_29310 [Paenibacillaceae bacterium]|nr:hypothetical protein EBB07_29310 [Paenibacillaceae bacterium]